MKSFASKKVTSGPLYLGEQGRQVDRIAIQTVDLLFIDVQPTDKELLDLLQEPLEDEVKLAIWEYFIEEPFEPNGTITNTLLSIVRRNARKEANFPRSHREEDESTVAHKSLAEHVELLLGSAFENASFWGEPEEQEQGSVSLTHLPTW